MDTPNLELIMIIVGVFTIGFWLGGKLMKQDSRTIGVDTPTGRMATKTQDVDFEITGKHLDQINDAIDRQKKIEAIKIFREATGAGLKDAKDAVELMMQHRQGHH